MRTPISKQRNKHIQSVLIEAAKLAPRYSHELAMVYDKELLRGNPNRATLAVARWERELDMGTLRAELQRGPITA